LPSHPQRWYQRQLSRLERHTGHQFETGSLTVLYTGAETSGAETPVPRCPSAEKSQRRNGGAETVAPKYHVPENDILEKTLEALLYFEKFFSKT